MLKPPVIAIVILAVGAGAALWFDLEAPASASNQYFAKRIPMKLAGWKCTKDEPPNPDVVRILGTDDIVTRNYFNAEGKKVTFLAVFASNNRRAVHPPEICLRGGGRILETQQVVGYKVSWPVSGYQPGTEALPPITELRQPQDMRFKELVVRMQPGQRMVVNYWFKTGSFLTCSSLTHEWNLFKNNLLGGQTSNSLLEATTDVFGSSPEEIEQGKALVHEFARTVFPYVMASMP